MAELPPGTITLLFTDIEGSTQLLQELGAERYSDALAEHRRVVRDAFGTHGGVEVDTQGDAFFYAFAAAPAAAAAARDAQEALADGSVDVRMGLHTGTPHRTGEGYVGDDVHLGARVAAAAHGGQVVLSKATRDLLDDSFSVRDIGEHRVKDFAEPVWIYQLGDGVFPPLRTISNTNLPRPASSFVGREREAVEVVTLVRGSRLVTLTGPGGSGKTRLSIEAASELVGEFRNGVFWVGLATTHNANGVIPEIAQMIGAQGDLAVHVGEREMLLLLDNFEQVVDAAPQLAALAEACPNLKLLVTSRELLRVRGEVEFEVLPLADPDAVELFCLRSGLEPSAAVEELCRRLDAMPLALELAAARTKALTPEQILERIGERLDLFKGGRDAEERQATLRSTIEWSHDLLAPGEQLLFARLGVFVGGCTLDAAEMVCEAGIDTIQSLVEKSLLRHTDARFWMLETIREYALERLGESDEGAVRRRFAEFFVDLAEEAGLYYEAIEGGRPPRNELVLPEQANLREVLEWAVDNDPELGLRLAVALEQFWVMQNPFEGVVRLEALLEHAGEIAPRLRGRAYRVLGGVRYMAGQYEQALDVNQAGLDLYRELGDEPGETVMLFRLGTTHIQLGNLDQARSLLEESLTGFRRLGKKVGECEASGNLASLELEAGDPELGRQMLEENIALAHEIGWPWWEASKHLELGMFGLSTGEDEEAERRGREGLALEQLAASRPGCVHGIALLAGAAAARGDAGRAGTLWGAIEAEERRDRIGSGWEGERADYASRLEPVAGADFEQARTEGGRLSLDEAVAFALAGRNGHTKTSRR
jgi:predicted ATPase/class 3 adenylate cyclase